MIDSSTLSFNALRNAAHQRATELGLPSTRDEAWRYVDCKPLSEPRETTTQAPKGVVVPVGKSSEPGMVLTNGSWDPAASPELPEGVHIHGVAGDSVNGDPLVKQWFEELDAISDIGALWSVSDMRSGLHLTIDKPVDGPLVILNLSTDAESAWRAVLDLKPGAKASILLIHLVAPQSRSSLSLNLALAEGSELTIDEVEFSSHNSKPMGQLFIEKQAKIARDARLTWNSASRGGKLVRHNWNIDLQEPGAHARCTGGSMAQDGSQAHHYLRMNHLSPSTSSEQLFKQVLNAGGRASFDGMVVIAEGADESEADQLCRTLILDDESVMGGRPQLEVHADEVTATHGASIAQPQPEELLYLRSRGLDAETARNLLIEGFLDEIAHGFSSDASQALAHQQLALTLSEEP